MFDERWVDCGCVMRGGRVGSRCVMRGGWLDSGCDEGWVSGEFHSTVDG